MKIQRPGALALVVVGLVAGSAFIVQAQPDAPTALTFSNASLYTLTLSWNASNGAGYQVFVSSSNSFNLPVTNFNNVNVGNVTSVLVSGLYPGTTYYAQVRAVDASNNPSAYSASVSAVTSGLNVPPEFEVTWSTLTASVQEFQTDVNGLWNGNKLSTPPTYAAELELANCNLSVELLGPTIKTRVASEMAALKQMGITTVQVCTHFPLLYQPYYDWAATQVPPLLDSTTINATNFQNFYAWVAQTAKSMNMNVSVESHVLFPGALPGTTNYIQAQLSINDYESARASETVTSAQIIQPNFLGFAQEPLNEAANSGFPDFGQPNSTAEVDLVKLIISSLTVANIQGLHTSMKIAAGIGDWNWPAFQPVFTQEANLVKLGLMDDLDLHIYPINNSDTHGNDYIANIMAMVAVGKQAGVPLSLTEVWPHTDNDSDLPGANGPASNALNARDLYCFWAPYYQYFFTTLAQLANYAPIQFVMAFNDFSFFGCADYATYNSPTPCSQLTGSAQDTCFGNIVQAAENAAVTNYTSGGPASLTRTGIAYSQVVANNGLPAPVLTTLSPTAAAPGTGPLIVAVTGSGFSQGAVIEWNGTPLPTVFGGQTQLFATIPAGDLTTPGVVNLTVNSFGGGTSAAALFTVGSPAPTFTALNPGVVTVGGADFTLTVYGNNFVSGASVFWNGSSRVTTFVGATEMQAAILASDIGSIGTADVTVANPGGVSGGKTLTVAIVSPQTDLSSVRVYPNPWRSDQHNGIPITFDHLTSGSTVKIFDLAGHYVQSLTPNAISGTWDLTNESGKKVASGLYFYIITDSQGNKTQGKITVIK